MKMNRTFYSLLFVVILPFVASQNFVFAQKNKSENVRLLMGTSGDQGQVDPAACVPYGMVRICPDSDPRSHVGYDYNVDKITGFSVNRISGAGCNGAGGNISIKPALKDVELTLERNGERVLPGFYSVNVDNQVKAEFSATHNVAFERYHYPMWKNAFMTIDFAASFTKVLDSQYEVVSENEIQGYIKAANACDHGAYKLYFNITISKPFTVKEKHEHEVELSFKSDEFKPVEVRVALSPIDAETARLENEKVKSLTFEQVKNQAAAAWENIVSKIDVKGGAEEDRVVFYTSFYRTFLSPANVTSSDGKYMATDGKVYIKGDFDYYSCWSLWDTYRTKLPMITLFDPGRMRDIANSLCNLYIYGKSDTATDFESTPTIRTEHAVVALLDAYKKGITDINLTQAYDGMKKEMDNLPSAYPDQVLENCIDWWAMGQIAEILGNVEDAKHYSEKSKKTFIETWNKEFKDTDESFAKMTDSGLSQGTRWQYRWALPQYLEEMITGVGGDQNKLIGQLDYFFENNLFNQGNETGLQAPFIFNRLSQYQKSQKAVRRILTEDLEHKYGRNAEYVTPYKGKPFKASTYGYLPEMDDDDGTMSAWYVFSNIGLYPLIAGEPWYEIISPFYDSVTIRLDNGKKFTIKTKNRKSPDDVIKQVTFNGNVLSNYRINHNDLINGGVLEVQY